MFSYLLLFHTCRSLSRFQCLLQPQPDHGVYTVFVKLGDTKIEVSQLVNQ